MLPKCGTVSKASGQGTSSRAMSDPAPQKFSQGPAWRESHRQRKQSFHYAAQHDQNQAGQMHKAGLARRGIAPLPLQQGAADSDR